MQIKGLIEIILYAKDMTTQVAFYRDTLGFPVLYPQSLDDPNAEMWILLDTGACKLALHGGGQSRLGADAPKLVFGVDDLDAAMSYLKGYGIKLGEIRTPAPGIAVCDGEDPEGNMFSLESHVT